MSETFLESDSRANFISPETFREIRESFLAQLESYFFWQWLNGVSFCPSHSFPPQGWETAKGGDKGGEGENKPGGG